jgi:DNA polymerase III subunit delta
MSEIKNKMFIFLYGPETYRLQKRLEEILGDYKKDHKNDLNLRFFEGTDFSFQDFKNETKTESMFKEKKIFILKNIFSNKIFKEDFLKSVESFTKSEEIIIFCQEGEVDKRESLFKFLQKTAKTQEFLFLEKKELADWLKKEIIKYKAEITPETIEKLVNFVGSDLWQLENEIIKLLNYAQGRKIKPEDVDLLVRPKIENDIFETINSLAEKRKDIALFLLHQHLTKGDSPLYLLSMINFQFRNLLVVKELMDKKTPYYEIAKRSGLHPFVVKKTYWAAEKFNFLQLKKIYQKIFQIDLAIKTGKIDPETALDLLVASL